MGALHRIGILAVNTCREAVRDRLLYNLLFFAGLMIASSILLAKLHIGEDERIYRDVGLAAIALFGVLIAIFVGIQLISREISQRTVYTILSKPVGRAEFLLGKYLGLVALLAFEVALMSGFFFFVLWFKESPLDPEMYWAVAFILAELALVTAVAIFFSSFTTPYLAGMLTVALWIIGHLLADLRTFGQTSGSEAIRTVTETLYWVLPNLDRLDLKADAAAGNPLETSRLVLAATYAAAHAALLLVGSVLLFRRRDLR